MLECHGEHCETCVPVAVLILCPAARAERILCRVTADTYVYATPFGSNAPEDSEAYDNHGGEAQFVVKGREYFSLLRFDLSAAKGMTVEKATLRFYLNTEARWLLSWMGVSTLSGSGDWARHRELLLREDRHAALGLPGLGADRRHVRPRRQPLRVRELALASASSGGKSTSRRDHSRSRHRRPVWPGAEL